MAKILRDAALIVGVVAISVATAGVGTFGAAAAATAASAATAVGATSAAALASSLTLGAAALSLGAGLLAKKPSQQTNPMQWQADPQAPIPYIMGRTYAGGQIIYRQTFGKDNVNETINTVLSAGPIQSFDTLYIDGVATTFNLSTGQVNITDRGKMVAFYQLGAQPEAHQLAGTNNPGITTASKMSGLAATSITLSYDTKGGHTLTTEPQVGWVVHGVKVYDPRLDSTYSGGSGSQRATDETTWTYSDNPYLHALTWLIGRKQNGKPVLGVGAPLSSIIMSQFVEGANVADANSWHLGGTLTSTDDKWTRLKDILQAGGGIPIRLGAQIGCIINTPRTSLATITVDDVVGDASVQATQAQRDRINAIVPRYTAEQSVTTSDSNGNLVTSVTWGVVPGSPVVVSSYVTFDGKQRQAEVDYTFVQDLTQSQQLARYDIENSREFGPITLPLKLRWMGYKPGDVVTANLPELGLNGQTILLMNRELSPADGTVTMTARSETNAKHAFALGQTGTAPGTPSVSGPTLIPVPGSGAWAITGTSISNAGTTFPALVVTGAADSDVIDGIVFEIREYTGSQGPDDNWRDGRIYTPGTTTWTTTDVVDAKQYQVSIRYRQGSGVSATRLILGPSTTASTVTQQGTDALNDIAGLGDDGILSKGGEKRQAIQDWNAIVGEKVYFDGQADQFGVSRTAYDSAYSTLSSYLSGLSPAWNDTTQDTPINPTTWLANWAAYDNTRANIQNALTAAGAQNVSNPNLVQFSQFEKGVTGWAILANASGLAITVNGIGQLNGINYYQVQATATASGQNITIGDAAGYSFPVNPGDRICVQSGLQFSGPKSSSIFAIQYFKADGSSAGLQPIYSGTADVGAFTLEAGFTVVPSGAVTARLQLFITSSSSGTLVVGIQRPMVSVIPAAQTTVPAFTPGPAAKEIVQTTDMDPDNAVDLSSIVPGQLNWRGISSVSASYGPVINPDSGIVGGSSTGICTTSTIATIDGNASLTFRQGTTGTFLLKLNVYYSLNGGAWTDTGIVGTNNATTANIITTWPNGQRWSPPSNGTLQFAMRVSCTSSAGAQSTVANPSINVEVVNWK